MQGERIFHIFAVYVLKLRRTFVIQHLSFIISDLSAAFVSAFDE